MAAAVDGVIANRIAVVALVGIRRLDAAILVGEQHEFGHDVKRRAYIQLHAEVKLLHDAVADRDRIEAVVEDANAQGSMVMPCAPTTKPLPLQSSRSFCTRVLWINTWPQLTLVATGAAAIVQVKLAGVASTLPSSSLARMAKLCAPTAKPLYVCGEVQAVKAAPSSAHAKVTFSSLAEKLKLAVVLAVATSGAVTIVVSGATPGAGASIVQPKLTGVGSILPM